MKLKYNKNQELKELKFSQNRDTILYFKFKIILLRKNLILFLN